MKKPKIAVIVGTRPCIIKQWSPYFHLKNSPEFDTVLIHSNQHEDLATQALSTFKMIPDYTCQVSFSDKLHLSKLVSRLIHQFSDLFYELKPDMVLVHGDTSTAFSASEAAFLNAIPIAHVEAGLRTSSFESPYPEEGYRRQISSISTVHFCPTPLSKMNLYAEGISKNVHIVGNSVVDSLHYIQTLPTSEKVTQMLESVVIPGVEALVLITSHRRETYGENLENFCSYILNKAEESPHINFIWPVHPNNKIKDTVTRLKHNNIWLIDPLEYCDFIAVASASNIVITDSGGVLEECSVLGKPTIILREETERPEALLLDNARLVGYNFTELNDVLNKWLEKPPKSQNYSVFGDGQTGQEITEVIKGYFHCE